jgi:hypothetical protein
MASKLKMTSLLTLFIGYRVNLITQMYALTLMVIQPPLGPFGDGKNTTKPLISSIFNVIAVFRGPGTPKLYFPKDVGFPTGVGTGIIAATLQVLHI